MKKWLRVQPSSADSSSEAELMQCVSVDVELRLLFTFNKCCSCEIR